MIAAVCRHDGRGLKTAEYDGLVIYCLPRRAGARLMRRVETDALLAGCRSYIPTPEAGFLASGPLRALDAREYLLSRLPDAAVYAARLWGRTPAQTPAQVYAATVTHACERTVEALAGVCRDVWLATPDTARAEEFARRMARKYGLPLAIVRQVDMQGRGVICAVGRAAMLPDMRVSPQRVFLAEDMFEVALAPPPPLKLPGALYAGMLYCATRAAWLGRLEITGLLEPGRSVYENIGG